MQIVSWGELMVGLMVLAVVWYGYVVFKYYRKDIAAVGRSRKESRSPVKWKRDDNENNSHGVPEIGIPRKNDTHALVHELMQELKLVFAAAVRDQLLKAQILEAIGIRLSKYTTLPIDIKLSISQHIVNECSLQVKIMVTQDDIIALW